MITFKNLPNTSTPLNAENLNANFNELNEINSGLHTITLNSISVTTTDQLQEVGRYTIPKNGTYLITGYFKPNHYNESSRELNFLIKKNEVLYHTYTSVISNAYTITTSVSIVAYFNKNDIITFEMSNSVNGKNWAFSGGLINFIKLK